MDFNVQEAKRELIYAKIALMGPSGSGKSYSALRVATGMLKEMTKMGLPLGNGKILVGNTEGPRGKYYANEFKYDLVNIAPPHNPEMYVEFIKWAVKQGYPIMIMDSTSHEWEGPGGCLDLNQQAGGTFQSWAKVTPRHNKFIEAIAYSEIHTIATMRGKDQYEIEKSDTGKQNVKKLGVGAVQRGGFEYEFSATFSLDTFGNLAKAQKDNTHEFEHRGDFIFTEEDGATIIKWANSGEGYTPMISLNAEDAFAQMKNDVLDLCKNLGGSGDKELMELVVKYAPPKGNPNSIKDSKTLQELYIALNALKDSREVTKSE